MFYFKRTHNMRRTTLILMASALMASAGCIDRTDAANKTAEQPKREQTATDPAPATYTIKTIDPQLKGAAIMNTIQANYKGRVVLVDFWATWCGPCRMAMRAIDDIKPELEKKGCTFVYITGESSPLDTWENMIPNISGDHYRLTNAQWEEIYSLYDLPGIPSYMIWGKDGKVCYDNFKTGGYPGSEVLKNNIEVALTK